MDFNEMIIFKESLRVLKMHQEGQTCPSSASWPFHHAISCHPMLSHAIPCYPIASYLIFLFVFWLFDKYLSCFVGAWSSDYFRRQKVWCNDLCQWSLKKWCYSVLGKEEWTSCPAFFYDSQALGIQHARGRPSGHTAAPPQERSA